jgi:hypothetical protein
MKFKNLIILFILTAVLFLSACKDEPEPLFSTVTITENLGSTAQDVFFIFTNSSLTDSAPIVPSISGSARSVDVASPAISVFSKEVESRIFEEIRKFEELSYERRNQLARSISPPSFAFTAVVDSYLETGTFYPGLSSTDGAIAATCQFVDTIDTKDTIDPIDDITLSIWVADDCWTDGGTKSYLVDDTMVTAMVNQFLFAGVDNDIYDWVTSLYGVPWGISADAYSGLVPGSEAGKITIFLHDIDNDNSSNGGTVGYFWSKDNYLSDQYSGSNERIMFYMDAVMYAKPDGTWDSTDPWPEIIYSTLGHEFQHMIQFYQKQIIMGVNGTDTWVNEMCSEITEDLVADKLVVPGPRGLGIDYSVGTQGITNSRLNEFNLYNDESLVEWGGFTSDYSSAYAFGAYLARNYGGAALFRKIVQSSGTDEFAVINAVNTLNGINKTFEQLLIEWGEYVLTSENESVSGYNVYGEQFQSSADDPAGNTYTLGSINLENYGNDVGWALPLWGPKIYNGTVGNVMTDVPQAPASNIYYRAGYNLTGNQSWTVELPKGVTLTVLKKNS